jgi:hypothetical protein
MREFEGENVIFIHLRHLAGGKGAEALFSGSRFLKRTPSPPPGGLLCPDRRFTGGKPGTLFNCFSS